MNILEEIKIIFIGLYQFCRGGTIISSDIHANEIKNQGKLNYISICCSHANFFGTYYPLNEMKIKYQKKLKTIYSFHAKVFGGGIFYLLIFNIHSTHNIPEALGVMCVNMEDCLTFFIFISLVVHYS